MSDPGAVPGPRRVLVHVGAPKTGTSYVQDVLFLNRESLAGQGILYPAERFDEHFLAALDLMELHWGGLETQAVGAWDRLAEQVRGWPGTSIVSHEILATASRQQVRRALDSFGDAEVHVVLSARDLVRQIPAEWQENVKHRRNVGYRAFLDKITDPSRAGELASWFWGVQEVPDILDRWGSSLPPERVHLVTVPKPGAPRDLLWQRFSAVLGLDEAVARAGHRPGEPVPRRPRDRAGAPDQRRGQQRRARQRGLPRVRPRAARAPHPLAALRLPAPRPAAGRPLLGRRPVGEPGSRSSPSRGTTWWARSTSCGPTTLDQPFADPDEPVEARRRRRRGAVDRDAAGGGRPAARRSSGSCAATSARRWPSSTAARGLWFRAKRRLVNTADDNRVAAAGLAAYRRVRGQQLPVGVATDLPGGVGVRARADQAADHRDPAPDRRRRAACRPPW